MIGQDNVNINKISAVTLREVTKENLREVLKLEVAPEQKSFVAPNAVSIAQAYFDRKAATLAPHASAVRTRRKRIEPLRTFPNNREVVCVLSTP